MAEIFSIHRITTYRSAPKNSSSAAKHIYILGIKLIFYCSYTRLLDILYDRRFANTVRVYFLKNRLIYRAEDI